MVVCTVVSFARTDKPFAIFPPVTHLMEPVVLAIREQEVAVMIRSARDTSERIAFHGYSPDLGKRASLVHVCWTAGVRGNQRTVVK